MTIKKIPQEYEEFLSKQLTIIKQHQKCNGDISNYWSGLIPAKFYDRLRQDLATIGYSMRIWGQWPGSDRTLIRIDY